MKKYLTIASVLGVIAFASVSFLAQADQQPAGADHAVIAQEKAAAPDAADPSDGEAAADNAAASTTSPADDKFTKDDQDCATESTTPGKDGAVPTDADKDSAYKNCMQKKGHSAAELKAQNGGSDPGKPDAGKPDAEDQGE